MFENFSLSGFTWKREPILYISLAVAVLNACGAIIVGDIDIFTGIQNVVVLFFGFFARGKVSPA